MEAIKAAAASRGDSLCEREKAYIRAALAFANGSLEKATEELFIMLYEYPGGEIFC